MRVCPKCGFHDPWFWRGSGVYPGMEFGRLSEVEQEYPELAKELKEARKQKGAKNFVFDKDYCYHLTKGSNVERQSLIENPSVKWTNKQGSPWHIPVEASPNKISGFGINPVHHGKKMTSKVQTKLLEVYG